MRPIREKLFLTCLFVFAMMFFFRPFTAAAQIPPDAGVILQDTLLPDIRPMDPSVEFTPQGQAISDITPGGSVIEIQNLRITGNSVFSEEEITKAVGDVSGKSFDLAGLRAIANRISLFYRTNGYPFAYAYIPEQRVTGGEIVIEVIEGRYGKVYATGDPSLVPSAAGFLKRLKPGNVIETKSLERSLLILGDQPGVELSPVIRPGAETGTGDLDVEVSPGERFSGQVTFDNHGNIYYGEYRGEIALRMNRVLAFGDEISFRSIFSDENLWLGQIEYSLPIGSYGLRGHLGYAHTAYELGSPFDGYTGLAKVSFAGLSYPLVRSPMANLLVNTEYRHKELDNELLEISYEKKTSNSWMVALQFDRRDRFGRGGITYGEVSVTSGSINSDNPGSIQGSFTKGNIQLNRLQNLPSAFTLFLSASAQWADTNLDSSESFTLGGANGVRAYPQGEAWGSEGWLARAELRYSINGWWTPYIFYDTGYIDSDAEDNSRSLAGAGIGVRYNRGAWSLNIAAAWKTSGGDARSVENQRDPQIWVTLGYRF
ncbi:MAG: ShlB/FhaC/HecB family hemolysin secretion/activation protein [Syntrophorhabdus aromaticivorans]|uniref:ShlB/FhaC/HecB family hemolysin secretion/activation protein n=1 Tax=Syntrophorhabdus aromaticivorans TaxID=328301 RepID=A0A971S1I2_9BACT|nr:ShlB/FhaC/HecB family hemolysin secretion/activation protein [Syntrophorhabdus aromaticivorans]